MHAMMLLLWPTPAGLPVLDEGDGQRPVQHRRRPGWNLQPRRVGSRVPQLGDYVHTSTVTVTPGGAVDLGTLVFEPPRSGPTLWEIGVPDRTAAEFFVPDADPRYASKLFMGKDRYRQYGLWERYAELAAPCWK